MKQYSVIYHYSHLSLPPLWIFLHNITPLVISVYLSASLPPL